MGLREEINEYREPSTKMVSVYKNPSDHSTDNGLLFSATYIAILKESERIYELNWFANIVEACQVKPGLYYRYPGGAYLNAHDDLTGVCIGGYLLGIHYSRDVLAEGEANDWSWNTDSPGTWTLKTYFNRFIDFVPFVRVCAGKPIGLISQLRICAIYVSNAFKDERDTSGAILLWLRSLVIRGRYPLIDAFLSFWKLALKKQHPNGMRDVFAIY